MLLLACASTQATPELETTPASNTVTASWTGGELRREDYPAEATAQLERMEAEYLMTRYQTEVQIAEGISLERLVEAEASQNGVGIEEFLQSEVESKIEPPSEADIAAFYETNKARMGGRSLEEMKSTLFGVILEERRGTALEAWVDSLKEKHSFTLNVPFPDMPRVDVSVDDDPSIGPEDAPVTIIEFAEYECHYCGQSKAVLDQVVETYGDKVRLVYRDFPLGFHQRAIPAAVAANCAGAQGQYFAMHDKLLANQVNLDDATFKTYAEELGLDIPAWETCLTDPAQVAEIQADLQAGTEAGVSGTPGFFINGVFLGGALPFSTFKAVIDQELASR